MPSHANPPLIPPLTPALFTLAPTTPGSPYSCCSFPLPLLPYLWFLLSWLLLFLLPPPLTLLPYCLQTSWLPLVLLLFPFPYISCYFYLCFSYLRPFIQFPLPLLPLPTSHFYILFTLLTLCPFSLYTCYLLTFFSTFHAPLSLAPLSLASRSLAPLSPLSLLISLYPFSPYPPPCPYSCSLLTFFSFPFHALHPLAPPSLALFRHASLSFLTIPSSLPLLHLTNSPYPFSLLTFFSPPYVPLPSVHFPCFLLVLLLLVPQNPPPFTQLPIPLLSAHFLLLFPSSPLP